MIKNIKYILEEIVLAQVCGCILSISGKYLSMNTCTTENMYQEWLLDVKICKILSFGIIAECEI